MSGVNTGFTGRVELPAASNRSIPLAQLLANQAAPVRQDAFLLGQQAGQHGDLGAVARSKVTNQGGVLATAPDARRRPK